MRESDDRQEFFSAIPPTEFEQLMLQASQRRDDEPTPAPEFYLPGVGAIDQDLKLREDRWTLEPQGTAREKGQ